MRTAIRLAIAVWCSGMMPAHTAGQAPTVIRKVNAEYPPELSTSYIIDNVTVRTVVTPDGDVFELEASAPLPDNVVHALEQWRFQPGIEGGHPVAYRLGFNVPVRRPIDRAMEFSLRRRWGIWDKEIQDAIKAGKGLDADAAAELRRNLTDSPSSMIGRVTLLAWLANTTNGNAAELSKQRADQIAWLVENLPNATVLGSPLASINVIDGPLADELSFQRVRDLWSHQLSLGSDKNDVLAHSTNFLRVADPEKAEQLLTAETAHGKDAAVWLGDLYGLAALGVTSLDLNSGLPATAGAKLPESTFARKARATLANTDDARVLLSGLATLSAGGRALAKAGHLPEGYAPLCDELLVHARKLHPATSATCDTSAVSETEMRAPLRIRVGGNVQQAKLIHQPPPTYPADARKRRIQGTMRFSATIDKHGEIADLELMSGPLIFYEESRKTLLRWKYKPTTLNGDPVDVVTQLDVNYTLSH